MASIKDKFASNFIAIKEINNLSNRQIKKSAAKIMILYNSLNCDYKECYNKFSQLSKASCIFFYFLTKQEAHFFKQYLLSCAKHGIDTTIKEFFTENSKQSKHLCFSFFLNHIVLLMNLEGEERDEAFEKLFSVQGVYFSLLFKDQDFTSKINRNTGFQMKYLMQNTVISTFINQNAPYLSNLIDSIKTKEIPENNNFSTNKALKAFKYIASSALLIAAAAVCIIFIPEVFAFITGLATLWIVGVAIGSALACTGTGIGLMFLSCKIADQIIHYTPQKTLQNLDFHSVANDNSITTIKNYDNEKSQVISV